jgi:hypothetical protein
MKNGYFPAFIINQNELTVGSLDFENIDENLLANITDNHCTILSRYYGLIRHFKLSSYDELKKLALSLNKDSLLNIVLNFISAKFHNMNLINNHVFNYVVTIEEIRKLKEKQNNKYYGMHFVSDTYPWLPYLLTALFQEEFDCSLVAFDKNNEQHKNVFDSISSPLSYNLGSVTVFGKTGFSRSQP